MTSTYFRHVNRRVRVPCRPKNDRTRKKAKPSEEASGQATRIESSVSCFLKIELPLTHLRVSEEVLLCLLARLKKKVGPGREKQIAQ